MANPAEFEFKIEGLGDVLDRLKLVSDRMQTSIPRKAARRGMNLVRDAARAKLAAIDDPETRNSQIWRNIITQESRRGRELGGILMKVGVRGGAGTPRGVRRKPGGPGGATQHWRHVELGTRKMRARPFMRESLANNASAVTDTVIEEMKNELEKVGV